MFKKSPISNRSYKRGFKIFSKILLEPSLRIGNAVVKDVIRSDRYSTQKNDNSTTSSGNHPTYKSNVIPNQSVFDIRKRGLDQCSFIHNLYYNTPRPETLLPLEGVLSKYNTASSQYINKATTCGYDYFTFAKNFFTKQISMVKKETTKRDYQQALDVLPIVSSNTDADAVMADIFNHLSEIKPSQE